MRRYQVVGYVLRKGIAKQMKDVFVAADEATARRLYARDHNVARIDSVTDVTDVDTGWTHVAFVSSDSEPDRTHEIRQNAKSGVTACGCKEYQFSRGTKTCHHLKALGMAVAAPAVSQASQASQATRNANVSVVSIVVKDKPQMFTVTRRAISLAPLSMQALGAPKTQRVRLDPMQMKGDPFGIDNDHEAFKLLDLIDAEFRSDPTSVQCFDLRVVQRVKECIERRKKAERRGDVPPLLLHPNDVDVRRMR
jgi:hypothetical protein